MPRVNNHGGGCCGIRHIYGFNAITIMNLQSLDQCIASVAANRLMEVTLTDDQLKAWWPELKNRGFKQVTRFKNSNSGNHVTVLHLIRRPAPLKEAENPRNYFRSADGKFASVGKAK